MNEKELRAEIERRKDIFRRQQTALPFAEKVRIAFELSKRRKTLMQARPIEQKDVTVPSSDDTK